MFNNSTLPLLKKEHLVLPYLVNRDGDGIYIHDRGICSSFSAIGNVYPSIIDVWAMIGELSLLVYYTASQMYGDMIG